MHTDWHQYDGVMLKEPETEKGLREFFTSKFKKWTGKHRESGMSQMKMAALAMLPSWDELACEQEDRRAEGLLEKVDQVCFCVKNCFLNEEFKTDTQAIAEVRLDVNAGICYQQGCCEYRYPLMYSCVDIRRRPYCGHIHGQCWGDFLCLYLNYLF